MQMWLTFAIVATAIGLFASEVLAIEIISLGIVVALLTLFHFLPHPIGGGAVLGPNELLAGFANPALITILGLLVIGQGLHQSGALLGLTQRLSTRRPSMARMLMWGAILAAGVVSAFMNNTPVVVMFIPILTALALRTGSGASQLLMPLSFITILGGMTTLIGSSTNLLVSSAVEARTGTAIGFFDFFVPGSILAVTGTVYVFMFAPKLLSRVSAAPGSPVEAAGRQYLAEFAVTPTHQAFGAKSVAGMFPGLEGLTVRLIQRGRKTILPPFEDVELVAGDVVLVAGTRASLTNLLNTSTQRAVAARDSEEAESNGETRRETADASHDPRLDDTVMAEASVAPGSRLEGRFLIKAAFTKQTNCQVVGIQRQRRMQRLRLEEIRMQAGDVLLISGARRDVQELSRDRDLLVLGGTMETLPEFENARVAMGIFAITVFAAAAGILPIVISALIGAGAMVLTGCLNINQAARALDLKIAMLVGASIAMAAALDTTGGARYLAHAMVSALDGATVTTTLSALFLMVAVMTNILSNNATALLFSPIALSMASELGVAPTAFIHTVLFAANCSFASPIGYQTNLLVMGPGNYRFNDFMRVGIPLVFLLWATFTALVPWYYGL